VQHIKQIKSHTLDERKTESVTKITFATGAISAAMWTMCKPELHSFNNKIFDHTKYTNKYFLKHRLLYKQGKKKSSSK